MQKSRTFVPRCNEARLEDRVVLSLNGHPFVTAPAGVAQNAINFTSNTYHTVIQDLNQIENTYARTGNAAVADSQLATLSYKIPYGRQVLAPLISKDLTTLKTGPTLTEEQATTEVTDLYETLLDRTPDPAGQAAFVAELEAGASFNTVVSQFLNSAEYTAFSPDTPTYVQSLYVLVLGRTGSDAEVAAFVNSGDTNAQIVTAFLNSPEYQTSATSINQTIQITPAPTTYYFGTYTFTGATAANAGALVEADLLAYLRNNVGVKFNVLKSGVNWSTDTQLAGIYNGYV